MSISRTRVIALGYAMVVITIVSSSALAQSLRVERQTSPPESGAPVRSLATGTVRDQENTVCKGVQVYYTLRGLAFSCADLQAGTTLLMVVDDSQFAGGAATAVVILERAAVESRNYIADPQRPGINMKVRYREPGAKAQSVCQLIQGTGSSTCREVVNFSF
jgi:hypothetical protein